MSIIWDKILPKEKLAIFMGRNGVDILPSLDNIIKETFASIDSSSYTSIDSSSYTSIDSSSYTSIDSSSYTSIDSSSYTSIAHINSNST